MATSAQAAPVDGPHALLAAKRWHVLAQNFTRKQLGEVGGVQTYTNAAGEARFHVVSLKPTGFVVIAADSEVEPVLAFGEAGQFIGKAGNPLYDLLLQDTETRVHRAKLDTAAHRPLTPERTRARARWATLTAAPSASPPVTSAAPGTSVTDQCVAPLVKSEWSQSTADNGTTSIYNYYTPGPNLYATSGNANNYVCGCVATAMAQVMRYWQWPQAAVGTASFSITVDGTAVNQSLRGGNGTGGAYDWADMVLVPGSSVTAVQAKAIGALTADAGAAVNMAYDEDGTDESGANPSSAIMRSVFKYANAASSYNGTMAQYLTAIRPNLDAGQPVMLSIYGADGGHEVVCDGYGYTAGTLYHHLNVGWGPYWAGVDNVWYNLPEIDPPQSGYSFTTIDEIYFNINPATTGEIVSGRVTQANGSPVSGVVVTLTGAVTRTGTTNSEGIYYFTGVPSNSSWTVVPSGGNWGYTPSQQGIVMGQSGDYGNVGDQVADFSAATIGAGPFNITPSAGAGGTISPSVAEVVNSGSSVTFTATPASGYIVNQWLVNSAVVQAGSTNFTLFNVASDDAVQVTFAQATPTPAQMISPTNFATLGASGQTFQWDPGYANSTFYLYLGNTEGAEDIYTSTGLSGTTTSLTVTGIPTDGRTIFAQLWSYNSTNGWQANNYTYSAAQMGSVTALLTPSSAAFAGAEWNIDGGLWQGTGVVISGVAPGGHTINFSTVSGYATPASQAVTVATTGTTSVTGTYGVQNGSLGVSITPPGAINGGAQWNLDGGAWENSGTVLGGLTPGNHTVNFSGATGFTAPASQGVTVTSGTISTMGNYTLQNGALAVTITPAGAVNGGARWNVDGGAWQSSSAVISGLSLGDHTVNFNSVAGYVTPGSQTVMISNGQSTTASGAYVGVPQFALEQPVGKPLTNGASVVDFGSGFVHGKDTVSFAIHNAGASTLTVQAITMGGSNASSFSAALFPVVNVAPGQSLPFGVSFIPAAAGGCSATMSITTNDTNTPVFTVALTGSAITTSQVAGTYAGLLTNHSGELSLTVNTKEAFTGKLMIGKSAFGLKGTFDGSGNYSASLSGTYGAVALHLGATEVTGTASGIPVIAWRSAFSAGRTITEAGTYTTLLNLAESGTDAPLGTGYGTMTVATNGNVALHGKLSDGTPFTASAVIVAGSSGDEIPVYLPKLTTSGEMVAGEIVFEDLTESNCDGALEWYKPKQTGTTGYYPGGFDTTLDFFGAVYKAPPHGTMALPFSSGVVQLSGGTLNGPISSAISLQSDGKVSVSGTNPYAVSVSMNASTGILSGSFKHPTSGAKVQFGGVLYQNPTDPGAAGYFLVPAAMGTAPSGSITLTPSE